MKKKYFLHEAFRLIKVIGILSYECFSDYFEFIQARILILTGTCKKNKYSFRYKFNNKKGIEAADLIRVIFGNNKIVREAVIIIKILLKMII